ncbi:MAG: hypothetical protein QG649_625 [Patescibacteria group bacterium]|nr:hypothetical protein [Patescibacteria group bacterium]
MFAKTSLYDQDAFYKLFIRDLLVSKHEVVIESPFITEKRMNVLLPIFEEMCRRNVKIIINTRNPIEHEGDYVRQAQEAVMILQDMGITVLYTAKHHRKLAIIDRHVTYEGSLNILSFSDSCEIMRRIVSDAVANDLYKYLGLHRYNKETNHGQF